NLVVLLLAMILDVSLAGFSLGWTLFVPVGFLLDPLFDAIGRALLGAPSLANLNNSVVLGSLVFWMVAFVPLWFFARWGVTHYRARVYERLKKTRVFQ